MSDDFTVENCSRTKPHGGPCNGWLTDGCRMNRTQEFAEGLKILARHDGEGSGVQPEHDQLYVSIDMPLDPLERMQLEEMGWKSEDADGFWWSKRS